MWLLRQRTLTFLALKISLWKRRRRQNDEKRGECCFRADWVHQNQWRAVLNMAINIRARQRRKCLPNSVTAETSLTLLAADVIRSHTCVYRCLCVTGKNTLLLIINSEFYSLFCSSDFQFVFQLNFWYVFLQFCVQSLNDL